MKYSSSSKNSPLINTIELNALLSLLEKKGIIDKDEYMNTVINVSSSLLAEAEKKGYVDKRLRSEIISSIHDGLN
ncbi:hypothetical protein [Oceanirhabdus sp. W0125-5]|uniref:hypothetical protein n=1 Tax=Oceanirhabdus sp. W0125-5 TaxID=2999116 RepID=UPI0022F32489|nr:hypothetical protein [Oceanirhabdus sp. W0125-5]WBW99325.1 hypothetical protein OW730_11435 [Oceanirhabdus sp. W0125-5]